MALKTINQIRTAMSNLNPYYIKKRAEQPLIVGLVALEPAAYAEMEDFLMPAAISHDKREAITQMLHRAGDPGLPRQFDLVLYQQGLPCPENAFTFYREDPRITIEGILDQKPELDLPLARHFHAFRRPVIDRIVHEISRENALFALATALPNIIPNIFELPWSVTEFASDTLVLTMNQVRMAMLVAAASDRPIGFSEERIEIWSIVAGAFGWRTIARELAGKIPLGGGVIPKCAIAYAATYVIGVGLERYNRVGYGQTRAERREVYQEAYENGRALASKLLSGAGKPGGPA